MTDDAAQPCADGAAATTSGPVPRPTSGPVPRPTSPAAPGPTLPAPVVDPGARDWARTRTSDATTPPPPPATAVVEAAREDHDAAPPVSAPAPRLPLPVQGLLAALTAGVLALGSTGGRLPLLAGVLVLQVALVAAVLALLDAPAPRGSLLVAVGAALAADAVVLVDGRGGVDRLAGVVGLGLVVALLHQLVRRRRSRVTESLADTLLGVVVVTGAACLVALLLADGGDEVLQLALAVAAVVLLVGRAVDVLLPRPVLAGGATRGWAGLVVGLLAGVGVALLLADRVPLALSLEAAALLALVVAATVVSADLAVDLGGAELRAGPRDARRVAALSPAAALLPYAVLGPVVLLAGRLVLP